jgi:hypothetical protein
MELKMSYALNGFCLDSDQRASVPKMSAKRGCPELEPEEDQQLRKTKQLRLEASLGSPSQLEEGRTCQEVMIFFQISPNQVGVGFNTLIGF